MVNDTWIGVDLDGTLANDTPKPYDPLSVGPPIPAMVNRVRRWIAMGLNVKIVTARMSDPMYHSDDIRKVIQDWTAEHIGCRLAVVSGKDYYMIELWDDRAVQVERNTGKRIGYSTRGLE